MYNWSALSFKVLSFLCHRFQLKTIAVVSCHPHYLVFNVSCPVPRLILLEAIICVGGIDVG